MADLPIATIPKNSRGKICVTLIESGEHRHFQCPRSVEAQAGGMRPGKAGVALRLAATPAP